MVQIACFFRITSCFVLPTSFLAYSSLGFTAVNIYHKTFISSPCIHKCYNQRDHGISLHQINHTYSKKHILNKRGSLASNRDDNTESTININEVQISSNNKKLQSLKDDIQSKFTHERSYDNMGILMPIAEKLDEVTGDWALSYADLSPATPKTPAGISFLLTNICYAFAGIFLITQGDFFYGGLVEIAGIVSFWYHFSQLEFGRDRSEVRLALLTDYITAGSALITGGAYMVQMGISSVPFDALIFGTGSIISLSLCWVWEFGYPYIVFHSIWHILSAYTGYLIGQAHIDSLT